jgi:hypothetical protein
MAGLLLHHLGPTVSHRQGTKPLVAQPNYCTGGVSYALYISLLISKLFCTKGLYRWRGKGMEDPAPPYIHPNTFTAAAKTLTSTYITECRIHNTETHVHKITNAPVFYMALGLNAFDVGKSITWAIYWKGSPFQDPKSPNFQGPPFSMAIEMDFPASKLLSPAPY